MNKLTAEQLDRGYDPYNSAALWQRRPFNWQGYSHVWDFSGVLRRAIG